jgi:hypothetical protein
MMNQSWPYFSNDFETGTSLTISRKGLALIGAIMSIIVESKFVSSFCMQINSQFKVSTRISKLYLHPVMFRMTIKTPILMVLASTGTNASTGTDRLLHTYIHRLQ